MHAASLQEALASVVAHCQESIAVKLMASKQSTLASTVRTMTKGYSCFVYGKQAEALASTVQNLLEGYSCCAYGKQILQVLLTQCWPSIAVALIKQKLLQVLLAKDSLFGAEFACCTSKGRLLLTTTSRLHCIVAVCNCTDAMLSAAAWQPGLPCSGTLPTPVVTRVNLI